MRELYVYSTIAELNKLKSYVTAAVWTEILKQIKVIKQVGYVIPDDDERAERAERIREEAEEIVNGREVFRAYENMGFTELSQAWQTIPEIKNEFNGVWPFIHYMAKIFPNSQAQKIARKRRPEDYPQQEKGGQGETESKEQTEKSNDAWIKVTEAASLAGVNPGTITRWANNGDIQDNGKRGKERKVLKSSVLLKKANREDDDRRKDTDEVLKDIANNIPDKH